LFRAAGLCSLLAWLLCAMSPAHAATDAAQGYRLAGTVAVGRDYLAFLEIPGGTQVLVRNGDIVGKARVAAIRDRAIDLVLPSGRVELVLEGSGKAANSVPAREIVTDQSDDGHVLRREVAVDPLLQAIERSPGGKGDSGTVLARKLQPVLNLPAGSRVLDVSGKPVTSADQALREIGKALEQGAAVLTLEAPDGMRRVYIQPARSESASSGP
jgi:hypothetical protein